MRSSILLQCARVPLCSDEKERWPAQRQLIQKMNWWEREHAMPKDHAAHVLYEEHAG